MLKICASQNFQMNSNLNFNHPETVRMKAILQSHTLLGSVKHQPFLTGQIEILLSSNDVESKWCKLRDFTQKAQYVLATLHHSLFDPPVQERCLFPAFEREPHCP